MFQSVYTYTDYAFEIFFFFFLIIHNKLLRAYIYIYIVTWSESREALFAIKMLVRIKFGKNREKEENKKENSLWQIVRKKLFITNRRRRTFTRENVMMRPFYFRRCRLKGKKTMRYEKLFTLKNCLHLKKKK